MTTSEQINEIATAMAKAQGALAPAAKDTTNPHFGKKYADIASVWNAARKPLADNGLSVWQDVTTGDAGVGITTRIAHTSGQWVEFGPLGVPVSKLDAQGVGSAVTYGKRYALAAALGVVAEDDDDGNAAKDAAPQPRATQPSTTPSAKQAQGPRQTAQPQHSTTADLGGDFIDTTIEAVTKKGERYSVKLGTGVWASTFKQPIADMAAKHRGTSEVVRVVVKKNGEFLNLLHVAPIPVSVTASDGPPADAYDDVPVFDDADVPF